MLPKSPYGRWAWWGLALYVGAVVVVLFTDLSPGFVVTWITGWVHGDLGWAFVHQGYIEFGLNILLFVPLGFLLALVTRRPWLGFVLCVALSAAAETAQLILPGRQATIRDVISNSLGALIGAVLAWLVVRQHVRRRARAAASTAP